MGRSPLYENAIRSIEIGILDYCAASDDARRIVSAARNLHAGILLLLKEKLRRSSDDNGELMYKNLILTRVNGVLTYRRRRKNGKLRENEHTVGADVALERLEALGCPLPEPQSTYFRTLREKRNRLEHHAGTDDPMTLLECIAQGFDCACYVVEIFLGDRAEDAFDTSCWKRMVDTRDVLARVRKECFESLQSLGTPSEVSDVLEHLRCRACDSTLVQVAELVPPYYRATLRCRVCVAQFQWQELVGDAAAMACWMRTANGGTRNAVKCPTCTLECFWSDLNACIACGWELGDYPTAICSLCSVRFPVLEITDLCLCSACDRVTLRAPASED